MKEAQNKPSYRLCKFFCSIKMPAMSKILVYFFLLPKMHAYLDCF
jgi:hypothetical protein